jgi:dynactin-4
MPSSAHINPIHAAASSALSREIPALKFTSRRSAAARPTGRDKPTADELPVYKPRISAATSGGIAVEAELEWLRGLDTLQDIAPVNSRWETSWAPTNSMRMVDLKPQRVPLHSKKSKRCPTCKHILIKPEQKAQSVRYKIKLVAANYLPNIEVILNPDVQGSGVQKKGTTKEEEVMLPGKTFPFHLVMSNPLYDPITVRVSVQRSAPPPSTTGDGSVPRRPPYAISLPTAPFPIAAFAEAWEYEDDEEMFDDDAMGGLGDRELKSKVKTVGVIDKRANVTRIGGEVVVSKEGKGAVKVGFS